MQYDSINVNNSEPQAMTNIPCFDHQACVNGLLMVD